MQTPSYENIILKLHSVRIRNCFPLQFYNRFNFLPVQIFHLKILIPYLFAHAKMPSDTLNPRAQSAALVTGFET